jgi:hypothetical protein
MCAFHAGLHSIHSNQFAFSESSPNFDASKTVVGTCAH